jgi:hypothetical protein
VEVCVDGEAEVEIEAVVETVGATDAIVFWTITVFTMGVGWLLLLQLKNATRGTVIMSKTTTPPRRRFLGVSGMLGGRGCIFSGCASLVDGSRTFLPQEGQIEEEGSSVSPQKGHLPSSRLMVVLLFSLSPVKEGNLYFLLFSALLELQPLITIMMRFSYEVIKKTVENVFLTEFPTEESR